MAERFTTDAAAKTGKSERTLQHGTARGATLGEEALRKVMGTSLDKPEQLNALGEAAIFMRLGCSPSRIVSPFRILEPREAAPFLCEPGWDSVAAPVSSTSDGEPAGSFLLQVRVRIPRPVYTKSFQFGHMIFSVPKKKLFIAFLTLTGLVLIGIGVTRWALPHRVIPIVLGGRLLPSVLMS